MERDGTEVLRQTLDALERRDREAIVALSHADLLFEPLSTELALRSAYRGPEGMRRYVDDLEATWREMRVTLGEVHDDGNCLLADGRIYARAHPPKSYIADNPAGFAWVVRDGLLLWGKVYPSFDAAVEGVRDGDSATALEQLSSS